jgi:hypothetical protein
LKRDPWHGYSTEKQRLTRSMLTAVPRE